MNDITLEYLMRKIGSRKDSHNSSYRDSHKDSHRDYREMHEREPRHDRGRGYVDFEGSMDFADKEMSEDLGRHDRLEPRFRDRDRDSHHESDRSLYLNKRDIHRWKTMMENEDGTRGFHYDMSHVLSAADTLGVHFDEFDEKELLVAVNMMYSDYCKVVRKYVSSEKELMFFVELAEAFLNDEDGPGASEKLALYFNCIVDA